MVSDVEHLLMRLVNTYESSLRKCLFRPLPVLEWAQALPKQVPVPPALAHLPLCPRACVQVCYTRQGALLTSHKIFSFLVYSLSSLRSVFVVEFGVLFAFEDFFVEVQELLLLSF